MNRIDIKSLIIGMLLCLCTMLLMGFGNSGDAGRYQIYLMGENRGLPLILDNATGECRILRGRGTGYHVNKPFKQIGER